MASKEHLEVENKQVKERLAQLERLMKERVEEEQ